MAEAYRMYSGSRISVGPFIYRRRGSEYYCTEPQCNATIKFDNRSRRYLVEANRFPHVHEKHIHANESTTEYLFSDSTMTEQIYPRHLPILVEAEPTTEEFKQMDYESMQKYIAAYRKRFDKSE